MKTTPTIEGVRSTGDVERVLRLVALGMSRSILNIGTPLFQETCADEEIGQNRGISLLLKAVRSGFSIHDGQLIPAIEALMRIIIHPLLEPTREIDVTTSVVAAVAQELSQAYGGSETLNWLEAERHVQALFSSQANLVPHAVPVQLNPR